MIIHSLKPQAHRIVVFLDRTIGCDWVKVRPIGNVCYDLQQRSHTGIDLYPARAIMNDWRISMAWAIVGNRATSGSDQQPMYEQLLRPTTDRTINRGDRAYDQSWHPTADRTINRGVQRSIGRSIVASCDRSLRPTTDRTINRGSRGTKRPIVRSIVASCERSYDQL